MSKMSEDHSSQTEEKEVKSEDLLDYLKSVLEEGTARRIIVRNKEGRDLLNFPLAVGVIGIVLAPFWIAVAGIVGLAQSFTVVVERRD